MRVLALYDIHGNVDALDAVLADPRAADPDAVLVGGDVVPGPFAGETLDRLDGARPCPCTGCAATASARWPSAVGAPAAAPDDPAAVTAALDGRRARATNGRARSADCR